jgi:glucokinase
VAFAVAIDLGGTQLRAALVDRNRSLLRRHAMPTPAKDGAEAVVAAIASAARQVTAGLQSSDIFGIGLSSPGPIDAESGVALAVPTIAGFTNFPLRGAVEGALSQNVFLENDGITAAFGEWTQGAGKGLRSMVYVTVSTGIGGGVIADGRVLRGRKGLAGHVGHLCIDHGGLRCACGNTGCWEAYAAGPAFAARARSRARLAQGSSLHPNAGTLQPADVFSAAALGDQLALSLVEEEARLLGVGITTLLHLFSPERVIIGGGLSNAFDQLHPGISTYVRANAMPAFRDVEVVKSGLGGDSGLVGAAELVFAATAT